ncbi:MAG: hypothetical protein U9N39_01340 [Campylobacterota bacterium]|nr:hypothetical protein [Campylobacterota bacterium]
MNTQTKEKLQAVVDLVSKAMVDPDIEIDYFIPGVEKSEGLSDDSKGPYILLTYPLSDYNKPTRKVHLGSTMLQNSAEEIANQVTFSIEEFKGEIDSVEMG